MTDTTAAPQGAPAEAPEVTAAYEAAKAKAAGTAVPPTPDTSAPAAPAAGAPPAKPNAPDTGAEGAPPADPVVIPQLGDPDPEAPGGLEATEQGSVVQYAPTGDAGMDLALSFVGKQGIKPDHPAMVAAGNGDFSFIKATLAALGDKAQGWEQHVALAEQSYSRAAKEAEANKAAATKAIHEAVGGEANLGPILKWASSVASPEEKTYFNAQLAGTPLQARIAATELARLYKQASGTVVRPAPVSTGPTAASTPEASRPLTRAEYTAEVNKIARRVGSHNLNGNSEYQALAQRFLNQR